MRTRPGCLCLVIVFSLDAGVDIIRRSRPDFAEPCDIYLYDFAQAEDLAGYLRRIGITDVETVPVNEADIMDVVRPGAETSEKKTPLSREDKRERNKRSQRKRRAEIKAKDAANGIVRKRGRPRD